MAVKSVQYYLKSGGNFYDTEKYNEACKEYQKIIEINPDNVEAYNNWGEALVKLWEYDKAIEKYLRAIEIDPDSSSFNYVNWLWSAPLPADR